MNFLNFTWLTIDCDDLRHIPSNQGHPTRSNNLARTKSTDLSKRFINGMNGFEKWMNSHASPVTLFVIADLFESKEFSTWMSSMLDTFGQRITIGCHGLSHRSWSAWPEDSEGFFQALSQAKEIIKSKVGVNWRPWFRAPGGYIAPWMAKVIAKCGFTVDSSINPSWLVKRKSGAGNNWAKVRQSITSSGLIEREWYNKWGLPVNGPALKLFPLSIISNIAWRNLPPILTTEQSMFAPSDNRYQITTVYWHILDHAGKNSNWKPPLSKSIFSYDVNEVDSESLKTVN